MQGDVGKKLSEPFDSNEVKFKPQMVKNNRALAMAYIDARVVMDRLDDVVGPMRWTDKYEALNDGSVICTLSILQDGSGWISKQDVGSLSEQPDAGDRLKAAFSDALKRAAVKFGIGRYLYRLSAQWVDYDPVKKQLVQLPQLPVWALPSSARVGGEKKEPAKGTGIKLTKDEEKAVGMWESFLNSDPPLDELNRKMKKLKNAPNLHRVLEKGCLGRWIAESGCEWDTVNECFVPPQETGHY